MAIAFFVGPLLALLFLIITELFHACYVIVRHIAKTCRLLAHDVSISTQRISLFFKALNVFYYLIRLEQVY